MTTVPSDLKKGEYEVTARTYVETLFATSDDSEKKDKFGLITLNLPDLVLRTKITKYERANYELLSVALRIRNYAAFATKSRHTLRVTMVGKRDAPTSPAFFLPMPAIYNGADHLPWTDGGLGETSFFRTGFGPTEDMKVPSDARQDMETLEKWAKKMRYELLAAEFLLNNIAQDSLLDVAVGCVGESIWADEMTDRLVDNWRALEAIARLDYGVRKVSVPLMVECSNKRIAGVTTLQELDRFRFMRNKSAHARPVQFQYPQLFQAAEKMYSISYQVASKVIKEKFPSFDSS